MSQSEDGPARQELSPARRRFQAVLVWFGLAERGDAHDDGGRAADARIDWFWLVAMPVIFGGLVAGDRGDSLGLIVFALFIPGAALGLLRPHPLPRGHRLRRWEDRLFGAPLFVSASLLVVPDDAAAWVPWAVAGVAWLLVFGAGELLWRRRNRAAAAPR